MAGTNDYARSYRTTRRSANEEQYSLILFPEDNTISVVKTKCIQVSTRPNFVTVLAGGKKYQGIVLHEGKELLIGLLCNRGTYEDIADSLIVPTLLISIDRKSRRMQRSCESAKESRG
jgi:hypothetical protein